MAKVTTKLQVTIPKVLADQLDIRPGDDIRWEAGPDAIRLVPGPRTRRPDAIRSRVDSFDRATARIALETASESEPRGWSREDLHDRGRPR